MAKTLNQSELDRIFKRVKKFEAKPLMIGGRPYYVFEVIQNPERFQLREGKFVLLRLPPAKTKRNPKWKAPKHK